MDNFLSSRERFLLEVEDGTAVLVHARWYGFDDPAEIKYRRLRHHIGEQQHAVGVLHFQRVLKQEIVMTCLQDSVEPLVALPYLLGHVAVHVLYN